MVQGHSPISQCLQRFAKQKKYRHELAGNSKNVEIPMIETVLRTHPPKSNDISEKISRDPGSLKIVIVVMTVAAGGNIPIDCVLVSMIVNNFAIQNLNSDLQKQNMSTYRLTPKTNTNTRRKRQIEGSEFL